MLNAIEELEEYTTTEYTTSDDEQDNPQELEYVQLKSASEKELSHLTQALLDEFDTLGICETPTKLGSDRDLYMTVIVNGFTLVNNYRKIVAEMRNNKLDTVRIKQENTKLEQQILALKQRVVEKDKTIECINNRNVLNSVECEELLKKNANLQKELASIKKLLDKKSNEWEHKIQQLKTENDDLRGIAERTTGSFMSKDVITANIIQKYKTNEESYRSIIKKLQANNQGLVQHLMHLMDNSDTSSTT